MYNIRQEAIREYIESQNIVTIKQLQALFPEVSLMTIHRDLDALEQAIRPPVEKLARHKVKSVRQRVRNLAECLDPARIPSAEALEAFILDYFCTETVTLTSNDTKLIDQYGRESFEDLSV